ncbi:MAG: helix-turn-helix domain-containing protein, partial [Ketobacteraceae bacterium]|nr:helix-turn-helix domain-containing protein [Ketobacteraceae bacterium]
FVAVQDDTMATYNLSGTTCELVFATWLLYIRQFWSDKHRLLDHLSVHFRHGPPQQLDAYYQLFGHNLKFNCPRDEVRFPGGLRELQFIESDRTLYQLMLKTIETVFAEEHQTIEKDDRLCVRCAELLQEHLPDELLSIEQLAQHFHMSVSTLRRRLRDEGYNYRKLADEIRKKLAIEYASKPDITLEDVVASLGFYDYSAMNKAFHRWFDKSPVEFYRK